MAIDTASPRSRRVLLAGALGAAATTVITAMDRPGLVRAADGEAVVVGGECTASSVTKFDTGATSTIALWGASDYYYGVYGTSSLNIGVRGHSNSNYGVYGSSGTDNGVSGVSDSGYGVNGQSTSNFGVRGHSTSNVGVYGSSASSYGVIGDGWSAAKPAILGTSGGANTGVQGYSGALGTQPAAPAKTGVYGYAAQDTTAMGVYGQSTVGRGVQGVATSGIGVRAAATTGNGLLASATTGTAANFATSGLKSGLALRTVGRVRFDNSVGIATIALGTSSVTVTPGIDLTTTSAVVATLQGGAGGATSVRFAAVNPTADTFTIYLTANATAAVKVAWHVFG